MESKEPISDERPQEFSVIDLYHQIVKQSACNTLSFEAIVTNMKLHPNYQETWREYLHNNPALEILARHQEFFELIIKYLAEHPLSTNVENIYQFLFQSWFKHQQSELEKVGLLKDDSDDFIEHCWVYIHAVALKLKESGNDSIDLTDDPFAEESVTEQWGRFFNYNAQTRLIAQCCPWQVIGEGRIGLYHPDIVAYFAYLRQYDLKNYLHLPFINGDEGIEQISQLLDRDVLAIGSQQRNHLVADISSGDIPKDDYFRLVYLSTKCERFARIAACAITVLNYARVSFSGMNLSHINIPYADLSCAILDSVNFQNALLSNVKLRHSWLNNVDFSGTYLDGVDFEEYPIIPFNDEVMCCCISAKNNYVVIATGIYIEIYDAINKHYIRSLKGHSNRINSIDISRDGNLLVSGSGNPYPWGGLDNSVRIWDILNNNEPKCLRGHKEAVNCVSLSSDGLLVASGSWDKNIMLWNVQNGSLLATFTGHTTSVSSVAFSLDSKQLISGSDYSSDSDEGIRIWNILNGEQVRCLSGHSVRSISVSSDGELIASGGRDCIVRVWNIKTGELYVKPLAGHKLQVNSVAFSHDGQLIASGSKDNSVRIWYTKTGELHSIKQGHLEAVTTVVFSADRKMIISGSGAGSRTFRFNTIRYDVRFWKIADEQSHEMHTKFGYISSIAISSNGQFVLAGIGGISNEVLLCRVQDLTTYSMFKDLSDDVRSVAISPDGNTIAVGLSHIFSKQNIILWDIKENKEKRIKLLTELKGCDQHIGSVNCLIFSPSGQLLASTGDDDIIRLWDTREWYLCGILVNFERTQQRKLKKLAIGINCIVFSPDCKFIASGGVDFNVRLWDVSSQKESHCFEGHKGPVSTVIFSPDGQLIASGNDAMDPWKGCEEYSVRLWNVISGRLESILLEHKYAIRCAAFTSNGQQLIIGCWGGELIIQDILSKQICSLINTNFPILSLACLNNFIVTGQNNSTLMYWKWENNILTLIWSNHQIVVSAEYCNIENAKYLSLNNVQLLKQRGAISSQNEYNNKYINKMFFSLTAKETGLELRRASGSREVKSNNGYIELIRRAIMLNVHLNQSSNGNTALHWAFYNNQQEKIEALLSEIGKLDKWAINALEIKNHNGKNIIDLFIEVRHTLSVKNRELFMKIIQSYQQQLEASKNEKMNFGI